MGLKQEFFRMVYACANELSRNALLYQEVYGNVRRRFLRRFPYVIYFRINTTPTYVLINNAGRANESA